MRQVCAYELGVPLTLVRVKKGSSIANANSITTGGSITSELNALVRDICITPVMSITYVYMIDTGVWWTVITVIILIIVTLKGAIWDFLQSPHFAVNCFQHSRSSGPGEIVCKWRATHRELIMCNMSCASWFEGTVQLLRLAEFKLHLF